MHGTGSARRATTKRRVTSSDVGEALGAMGSWRRRGGGRRSAVRELVGGKGVHGERGGVTGREVRE